MEKWTETWVRRDQSGRVDVSENTRVLDRSVFRDAGDVFLVRRDVFSIGRDVEKERIDVEVTFLGYLRVNFDGGVK